MTTNSWLNEYMRWLNVIEQETTHSLNVIGNDIQRSVHTINPEFIHNFLESGICRLKICCREFDMKFRMVECLQRSATVDMTNNKSIANVPDVSMKNATSKSHPENITSNNLEGTLFRLSDSVNDDAEITNNILMPDSSCLLTPTDLNDIDKKQVVANNSKYRREFVCYYCQELKRRGRRSFIFGTIRELYAHCQSEHSTKPFQYYAVDLLICSVAGCRYYSTFSGLQNHHNIKHPNDIFVVVQNQRCAFCHDTGDNLNEHDCHKLKQARELHLFNPICFTDDAMAELQAINNGFRCKHCNTSFDSSKDMLQHHHQEHGQRTIDVAWSEIKPITGMICGCCQIQITADSHVQHLKSVAQKRWSNANRWEIWFHRFRMEFLKTKVIFGNGLVVFKQNLINNDFGGYPGFKNLSRSIFTDLKNTSGNLK